MKRDFALTLLLSIVMLSGCAPKSDGAWPSGVKSTPPESKTPEQEANNWCGSYTVTTLDDGRPKANNCPSI